MASRRRATSTTSHHKPPSALKSLVRRCASCSKSLRTSVTRWCRPASSKTPSARSSPALRSRTENPGTALSNATQIREYGFPADYWDTYPEKIAAVTAEDVQRVARKYIPLDNIVIIAVGDATKIRSVLAAHGPVEDWDSEGRRVQ